jgi:DNA-binding NarL/FixJ family response regulator
MLSSVLLMLPGFVVVGEASDGPEAIRKAQALKPDLVLLDVGLPIVNGIETAQQISEVTPYAKIVFLTQNSSTDIIEAALSSGAQGYVLKMDVCRELLLAIKSVLRGERFVSKRLIV